MRVRTGSLLTLLALAAGCGGAAKRPVATEAPLPALAPAARPPSATEAVERLLRAQEVAREWFARYLDAVAGPILWLYAEHGIALEAHQQNTLVVLDRDGWPAGGRYRDNQGFYFAASHAARLSRWLPRAGEDGD